MSYTEDTLVQQTTAEYLENELGWESVYAYNKEDFGTNSLLGRNSKKEVVLTRHLEEALVKLNPGLPVEVYEQAVKEIVSANTTQTMAAINKEKYALYKDGVSVKYRNEDGEQKIARLKIFDFNQPEANEFLCVRELIIHGDLYNRRPDILGFVNGIPLLFMECKNIHVNLKAAYEKNFSDYKDTVPHLFHHNAFVVFGNGDEAKIGSITGKWGHFNDWKRLNEADKGVVAMQTLLMGTLSKSNFIDLFENFILYDDSRGEIRKIVAWNHQFLGVNRAIESVKHRKELDGKLGVFWHTQGSGKSYSMVMLTRKIHRKLGSNFTFVILTDRQDLDEQIYKTYAGCDVFNENEENRAGSGDHLSTLMTEHKSYVFSLIHKFNKEIEAGTYYTDRDDIIVITDEAHRTQYGEYAMNMRRALPNAGYIGFTGTPLIQDDEITRQVFGNYVSTYDFQRAVEDNATVPLYYDARGQKLGVAIDDVNERIAAKLEEIEIAGIDVEQRLEKELSRDYHIITAEKRLEQVARDFVNHYSTNWETGKTMFVCIDKLTCVKMHGLIVKYWKEKIEEIRYERKATTDKEILKILNEKLVWMKETIAAVVVSEEQGEVDKFRQWGLDITQHRKVMKDGLDVPERMQNQMKYLGKKIMPLDEAFKAQEHPFRIAIVCAMWLTGFDVPSLSTLYLDKPMKAHTLMQAIARANRVHEGKNNGLIVDYIGIVKHLREALATFARDDAEGGETPDPVKPEEELLEELGEAISLVKDYLKERKAPFREIIEEAGFERNAAISQSKEVINENDRTRKEFEVMAREVFKKFKACLTVEGIYDFKKDRDAINIIYKSLQRDVEKADISEIIRELHEVVDEAIDVNANEADEPDKIIDISNIDFDLLRKEFARSSKKNTTVHSLKYAIENRLQQLLSQNPLRTDFQKRFEEIVENYNSDIDRATIEETFNELIKLSKELTEEEKRGIKEDLSEETLAIFDLLMKPELTKNEINRIKKVSVSLLSILKEAALRVDQWRDKEPGRDGVKKAINDFLYSDKTGLPNEFYTKEEVDDKSVAVYRHVFRAYPYLPSPVYSPNAA